MESGLIIVGTPIGNLGDITARAVQTLKDADLILAEDTRQTRKLLTHFEINTHCISCHKFNEAQRCEEIIQRIRKGESIAMVTDSGMPCISDPGSRIIVACRDADVPITSAPGPTAVTTAMALSGFGGHGFLFAGFPPRKSGARKKLLAQCAELPVPAILYESPYRLLKLVAEIGEVIGEKRRVFIARELTKKFEELICGTPQEVLDSFDGRNVKGECVVIIAPVP
jgi:16S rRNA (cytidine1402-2'-O)-methyltransferase